MVSCSPDTEILPGEQPVVNPEDSVEVSIYAEDNRWIYSQMNEHYLWRQDLPDSLSCDYTVHPASFFKSLLSPKDRFSYCLQNENYESDLRAYADGFAYQEYRTPAGEQLLQVLYVLSEDLKSQCLNRGDWLKPSTDGSTTGLWVRGSVHRGVFEPLDTLYATKSGSNGTTSTVYLDSIYQVQGKKVGYLCYLEFDETKDLEPSLKRFYREHIDELILDLRYNPGGYLRTCRYLSNSIVAEQAYGKIFQQCTYNDRISQQLYAETGSEITSERYEIPTNGLENILSSQVYGLNLKHVYVLTSKYTASASEATIVCLRPYTKVTIIGETTYGKGVGSYTIADNRYRYKLQPITMRYYNALMETTPDEGLPPTIEIPGGYDTIKKNLGDTDEPLLSTALQCIAGTFTKNNELRTYSDWEYLTPVGNPSFFRVMPEFD